MWQGVQFLRQIIWQQERNIRIEQEMHELVYYRAGVGSFGTPTENPIMSLPLQIMPVSHAMPWGKFYHNKSAKVAYP